MENEVDDEEGEEREGEGTDEDSNTETDYVTQYLKKWGWVDYAVIVKEIKSITLDEVFEINIVEFLNLVCYHKDKNEYEKKQQEEEYAKRIKNR